MTILGTDVIIGAGIFALTGQMAQMTGALFPLVFLTAAIVVSFSANSYIKISNVYPSAGGIVMYLHKAYGDRLPTRFNALLMYFSMVIAQSFLARTFGSYTMQLFGGFVWIKLNSDPFVIGVVVVVVVIAMVKQVYIKSLVTKKTIENDALVLHYRR